jgi:hypothetical protein
MFDDAIATFEHLSRDRLPRFSSKRRDEPCRDLSVNSVLDMRGKPNPAHTESIAQMKRAASKRP